MPLSVWRRVRARVHLSLTPIELSNPVRSATKKAFSSLLMRYSPELGGAVVAHIGPVELCGPPAFIDASPFAHVAAIATLLVFAPTKGTELLGVVTHVGPDHLGLSVLSAFHAVLPIDGLEDVYRFESKYTNTASIHSWKRIDGPDHVTVHRQLRFIVSELKPTRSGLFQIIASLDPSLRKKPSDLHPIGLVPREKEITLSTESRQQGDGTAETGHNDVLHVTTRTSSDHVNDRLRGDELLTAGNDMLGDALMPTTTPISSLKKKKRRRSGTEPRSVSFEDSETQKQHKQPRGTSQQVESKDIPSQAAENTERSDANKNGEKMTENVEIRDRKKRKKEKKKKKKHSVSGEVEKRSESNGVKPSKHGHGGDENNSGLLADRQETTSAGERNRNVSKDASEPGSEEQGLQKREGKHSKKKRRKKEAMRMEENVDRGRDEAAMVKQETKTEATNKNEDGVDVIREISMRRDAEKAVELRPMKGEENESEKKKKKKKKRRRSLEEEPDEHRSKKKKRKKRMSEAMEMERRRSLQ